MKTYALGLVLVLLLTLCGCGTCKLADHGSRLNAGKTSSDSAASRSIQVLKVTATIDGSGKFVFTPAGARYEHLNWSPPTNVTINDSAWGDLGHTPDGWLRFSDGLDLSRAWIVEREGRDVIALEPTAKGFDLFMDDSPNGAADYSVTIAIPRRESD